MGQPLPVERTRGRWHVWKLIADGYERSRDPDGGREHLAAHLGRTAGAGAIARAGPHGRDRPAHAGWRRPRRRSTSCWCGGRAKRALMRPDHARSSWWTTILARFQVAELLHVTVTEQITQQRVRAYRDRAGGRAGAAHAHDHARRRRRGALRSDCAPGLAGVRDQSAGGATCRWRRWCWPIARNIWSNAAWGG